MWGKGASWVRDSASAPHEDHVLRLDASKARFELAWKPELNTETALDWTMKWYRAWNEGHNMAEFTKRQIVEYEELCAR
jgi:CDP-glucose 4,6-dehydratase